MTTSIMHIDCIDHGRETSLSPEGYLLVCRPEYRKRKAKTSSISKHRLILLDKLGLNWWDERASEIVARHTCDNPRCVNPDHLVPGTRADNNKDRAERGRSAKRVPSRQRLTLKDCEDICAKHLPRVYGVTHLAREYGVDTNVIYKVLRGEYPCQLPV